MYVAGVVLLVASFLPLLEMDFDASEDDPGFGEFFGALIDTEWSAWSDAFSIFPLVTLPVLCVLLLVGARALRRFTAMAVPERVLGFPLPVVRVAVAAFATAAVGAQLLRALVDADQGDDGSFVVGPGGWLAAFALAAVVVTSLQEAKPAPAVDPGRPRLDTRAAAVVLGGAAVMAIASFLDVWSAEGDDGVTAWGEGGRPVFLVPLAMAVLAVAATVVDLRSDERRTVLGVELGRWRVLLGALALFAALALLIGNPIFGGFSSFVDTGAGVYMSLLGAVAVLVGTLLKPAEQATTTAPASEPSVPPTSPPTDPPLA